MTDTPDFVLFLGRFHPLVVHLPIGFLFFAFVLEVYGNWQKNDTLKAGIPLALFLGGVSALVACILGYMLSLSGDYDEGALDWHFWFGVATTIITFLAWLIRIEKIKLPQSKVVRANIATLTIIVILLSFTGHYGGNLTHGSDYLTQYAPFSDNEEKLAEKVTKLEDAEIYTHLVDPILESKCTSCHNSGKKKGGLMMHDSTAIAKGGKNGPIIMAGNSSKSEMIRRVLLSPNDKKFMPPKGKSPLTDEEIAILKFWIDNNKASFSNKLDPSSNPKEIVTIASSILGLDSHGKPKVALAKMPAIDSAILNDLKNEGFILRELVFESNLYDVVLPPKSASDNTSVNQKLEKLAQIKDHILWLSLEDNFVSDTNLKTINGFKNLQKLVLNSNPISDEGIAFLENLTKVKSINLFNTPITNASLATFSKIKSLKKVYAWQTKIDKESLKSYQSEENPQIILGL